MSTWMDVDVDVDLDLDVNTSRPILRHQEAIIAHQRRRKHTGGVHEN